MTELVWSSRMMRERIAPPGSAPSKGERIREVARQLHWKYSRAFAVWYCDERVSLKPRELRQIEEITGVRYGQQEIAEVEELISRAGALLNSQDSDFHSAFVAAVRAIARTVVGSRTEG